MKVNKHMHLSNKWNASVKNNIVEFLNFINFKFVRNSTFKVKIFGKKNYDKKPYMAKGTNIEMERNGLTEDDKTQMKLICSKSRKKKTKKGGKRNSNGET